MQRHNGLVRPYQSLIGFLQQAIDLVFIATMLFISLSIFNGVWGLMYSTAALIGTLLFFIFARQQSLYHSWRGESIHNEAFDVLKAWGSVVICLLLIAFANKTTQDFSRKIMTLWFIATPATLIGLRVIVRLALRQARASGRNTRSIVIVGSGSLGVSLAKNIQATPWLGINIMGFYDDNDPVNYMPDPGLGIRVIGDLKKLSFDARCGVYDEVYIALPMRAEKQMKQLINDLADSSVQVQYTPDIFTFNLINSRIRDIGGLPIIGVYDSPLDSFGHLIKRIEDIFIGGFILLMIALPMLFIGIGIKLTSKGSVFFKQKRYGLNGDEIWVWKFRTMTSYDNGDVIEQARKGDNRITPFGRFLRQTSLDELPQFINVLQGTMSIVGPRPHAVAHNELYRQEIEGYMQRHLVKPGITGWAQVNGWRGETDTLEKMQRRVEHDMHYIRNWSLWMDIKIIALTIFKGFIHKNAY